jgi:hypothetical protein
MILALILIFDFVISINEDDDLKVLDIAELLAKVRLVEDSYTNGEIESQNESDTIDSDFVIPDLSSDDNKVPTDNSLPSKLLWPESMSLVMSAAMTICVSNSISQPELPDLDSTESSMKVQLVATSFTQIDVPSKSIAHNSNTEDRSDDNAITDNLNIIIGAVTGTIAIIIIIGIIVYHVKKKIILNSISSTETSNFSNGDSNETEI